MSGAIAFADVFIFLIIFIAIFARIAMAARRDRERNQNRQGGQQNRPAQTRQPQSRTADPWRQNMSGDIYGQRRSAASGHSQRNTGRQQTVPRGVPAKKSQTGANTILERAKANTSDVHRSHSVREAEAEARRTASKAQQPQTEFGSATFGSAVSGLDSIQTESQRKARLQQQLSAERNDMNSQSGRNRIMESAKENAIQSQLDNLEDGERDLMKEVRDLIITGPNYKLPYSRDFVAEGTELLNSYYQVKGF